MLLIMTPDLCHQLVHLYCVDGLHDILQNLFGSYPCCPTFTLSCHDDVKTQNTQENPFLSAEVNELNLAVKGWNIYFVPCSLHLKVYCKTTCMNKITLCAFSVYPRSAKTTSSLGLQSAHPMPPMRAPSLDLLTHSLKPPSLKVSVSTPYNNPFTLLLSLPPPRHFHQSTLSHR